MGSEIGIAEIGMGALINLPKELKVVCAVEDAPVPGAWVTATLHMNEKTDFISFHGPAGPDGSVAVRGDDILHWSKNNREFAAADYADPETAWSGTLTLTPLTVEAARAAIKFYKMFQDQLNYPATFSSDLRALISTLTPLQDQMMTLTLAGADPPGAAETVNLRRRPV